MNAPIPVRRVDPRLVLLARASALETLVLAGEISLDAGFDRLVDPFLAIIGPEPKLCEHCGDPPWRHEGSWCLAVRKAQARRDIEAVVCSVRASGIAALKHPDNIERLSRCDARARAEINSRISKLQARRAA
jgi:hypothetical protein